MRSRAALALLAAAPLVLAGCQTAEEKLLDRRHELRAALQQLHGAYGGSGDAREDEERDGGVLRQVIGEVDRLHFEQQCLAVGRGERPLMLSRRLAAFLEEPENARACRRVSELQAEVEALERRVADR
jgi:hypothetical protein